ncbi:MAG: hypothetical protein IIX19_03365 [Alistipes sp.]|nr:hypothetical protein [Alistipes sp.]
MKKSLFMLLMLAVAGVTMSCEKEVAPNKPENETPSDGQTNVSTVNRNIVGLWVLEGEINDQLGDFVYESTFRFWEDGTGYRTTDEYEVSSGRHMSMTRGGLTYECEGDILRIGYTGEEAEEVKYSVESNRIIFYVEEVESGMIVYHKKADADRRFLGDWSTMRAEGDYYYDDHIKFVTPTDCFMYHNKYDNPMAAPIEDPSHPVWYKYTFDDDVLYITSAENMNATPTKKYYRFAGDKLYLSNTKGGLETCYSTIKKE